MRNCLFVTLVIISVWAVGSAHGQSNEGPVWDVQFIRTKPNRRDAYLLSLKVNTKPILEEEKRQGLNLDYKILVTSRNMTRRSGTWQ
jgi:hypothetical protein